MTDNKIFELSCNKKKEIKQDFVKENITTAPNSNSKQLSSNEKNVKIKKIFSIKKQKKIESTRDEHLRRYTITFFKNFTIIFLRKNFPDIKISLKNYKIIIENIPQFIEILTNQLLTLLLGKNSLSGKNNNDVLEEKLNKYEGLKEFLNHKVISLIYICCEKEGAEIQGDLYSEFIKQFNEKIIEKNLTYLKEFMKKIDIKNLESKKRKKKRKSHIKFKTDISNNNSNKFNHKSISQKSNNEKNKIINDTQIKNDSTNKIIDNFSQTLNNNKSEYNPSNSIEYDNKEEQNNNYYETNSIGKLKDEDIKCSDLFEDSNGVKDIYKYIDYFPIFNADELSSNPVSPIPIDEKIKQSNNDQKESDLT